MVAAPTWSKQYEDAWRKKNERQAAGRVESGICVNEK
jgi:hypothetical protein